MSQESQTQSAHSEPDVPAEVKLDLSNPLPFPVEVEKVIPDDQAKIDICDFPDDQEINEETEIRLPNGTHSQLVDLVSMATIHDAAQEAEKRIEEICVQLEDIYTKVQELRALQSVFASRIKPYLILLSAPKPCFDVRIGNDFARLLSENDMAVAKALNSTSMNLVNIRNKMRKEGIVGNQITNLESKIYFLMEDESDPMIRILNKWKNNEN